ncbi:TBP-interacting protein [Pyrococcus yayanosii]|uniref:TBP-interacting protein n=1 Tax=Pyrococcus yayanosii TaxID=1008460 RepID=UPI00064FD8E8|nr:TBP-interacting protein [Pyrococcus yayanosii]
MRFKELDEKLKKVYAKVRGLDDYYWSIQDGEVRGIHKRSGMRVRIRIAEGREHADKMSREKEVGVIDLIVIPGKGTFYLNNGTFIMSLKFLRPTLQDVSDHIVWSGFKVVEKDGALVQEDFYEYLGGRLIEHLKRNMIGGRDYVFWQFYRCPYCNKYVDIESLPRHMKAHGEDVKEWSEEKYEVLEINFADGKVYNKFGKEVPMEEFSEEAVDFIKESFEEE